MNGAVLAPPRVSGPPPSPPAPADVHRAVALLLAAVVAAYLPSLAGPFQFDDWWAIVGQPAVHDLRAWAEALPGIRPLLKLVNTMNWLVAPTPAGFRAVNIAAHAAAVLLLGSLLRRWLPVLAPGCARPGAAAFVAALLFALHPAATEAVAYVSGRSIVLSTVCAFAALRAWTRALDGAPGRGSWTGAAWFAAALAVRETAIVTPLAWLLLARCGGVPWRAALAPLRPLAWLLPVAVVAAAATPGYRSFAGWSLQTRDLPDQLRGQLEAHLYLLTRPLPGVVLNIDPDVRVPPTFAWRHALLLAVAAGAALLAWRQRTARPWLGFALGWYVLQLAPANSLMPRFDLVNDRHLYAALPGPLLVVSLMIAAIRWRAAAFVLAAGLAAAALVRTLHRIDDYRSELALWEATVAHSPDKARPWTNLGFAREGRGDIDGARAAYRRALRSDPAYRQAAWNLAALDEVSGD